jgi:hypothetical protein
MIYIVRFKKRKSIFDKPFTIGEENGVGKIEIISDKRGKLGFIRKYSGNAVFPPLFKDDEIISPHLTPIKASPKDILIPYVPSMLREAASFAKKRFPLGEVAVFARGSEGEKIAKIVAPYARLVSVVGEKKEGGSIDGVYVRFVERLKKVPDGAVAVDFCRLPSSVPVVDLGGKCPKGRCTISFETVSFKAPPQLALLECETISAECAAYFIENGCDFAPEMSSLRKKCEPLFTFC